MQEFHLIPYPAKLTETGGVCSPGAAIREVITDSVKAKLKAEHPDLEPACAQEAYTLSVQEDSIVLSGTEEGLRNGRTTFRQLRAQFGMAIPCLSITDYPRFRYRGFMLDSSRHFLPAEDVKKLIAALSWFKINRFHWHLADDQGWRAWIRKYPKLTEIGSVRGEEHMGLPDGYPVPKETRGFYTQDEIRDVVRFAAEHGIEVLPEIEIPGHETAMLAAYPEYSCSGEPVTVGRRNGIFPNLVCAGREDVFRFLTDILDELMELFPYEEFHIGGDEAVKDHWKKCPACQKKMHALGLPDEDSLQQWFTIRIAEYLKAHGRKAVVWNDSLRGESPLPPELCRVQWWLKDEALLTDFAGRGGYFVNSKTEPFYLGKAYSAEDAKSVLRQDPYPDFLPADLRGQMAGIEAPLWGEHVPDLARASYVLFPMMPAVAELSWTDADTRKEAETDDSFAVRFRGTLPALAAAGITDPAPAVCWFAAHPAEPLPEGVTREDVEALTKKETAEYDRMSNEYKNFLEQLCENGVI